jgi:spermidine synthase
MDYLQSHTPHVIERALTPRGEIQLQRRGADYEIIINGVFLMATYNGQSERLLVRAALKTTRAPRRILIGGLGVGYSLAEALSCLSLERVTVVEIEEKIIEWNRSYLADFSNNSLDDPKTSLIHADLIRWMSQVQDKFDVICLDIDNGPDWVAFEENNFLYGDAGLDALSQLLNPNGVVSFWSASSSPSFAGRLKKHFSFVEELEAPRGRGEPDYIYIGMG